MEFEHDLPTWGDHEPVIYRFRETLEMPGEESLSCTCGVEVGDWMEHILMEYRLATGGDWYEREED